MCSRRTLAVDSLASPSLITLTATITQLVIAQKYLPLLDLLSKCVIFPIVSSANLGSNLLQLGPSQRAHGASYDPMKIGIPHG